MSHTGKIMKGKKDVDLREDGKARSKPQAGKAEEIARQQPKQVTGQFDRQEKRHAKSEGHPDVGNKAAVHEGRENGRDRSGRPPDRKEEQRVGDKQRGFKGKSILNTYRLGATRNARNSPR